MTTANKRIAVVGAHGVGKNTVHYCYKEKSLDNESTTYA